MVKRGFLIIALLSLFMIGAYGQEIQLKNGQMNDPDLFELKKVAKRRLKSDRAPLAGYFVLLQFDHNLNYDERNELEKKGIDVISHFPVNAYSAIIRDYNIIKNKVAVKGLIHIIELPANFKYDLRFEDDGPKWFVKKTGTFDVNVLLVEGTRVAMAKDYLADEFEIEFLSDCGGELLKARILQEDLGRLASINWIKWIEPVLTNLQLNNVSSAINQRISYISNPHSGLPGLSGKNIKVGVWDGGEIADHIDLQERVTNNTDSKTDLHATHVTGTIAGRGLINPQARGMATNVQVYASDMNREISLTLKDMRSATDKYNLSISSNSWGPSFDRSYCASPVPYMSEMVLVDQLALDYPNLNLVFANGNEQTQCHHGFGTTTWTMKNVLYVGAVDDSSAMSDFSSFGPMYDGRFAPHVCADGVDVLSTQFANLYETLEGTSMATPVVSGGIALLSERYLEIYKVLPTSQLIKAILCNTADDKNEDGPDFKYGYGVANFKEALECIEHEEYIESELSVAKGSNNHTIEVPANCRKLKVLITWNDIPGTPLAGKSLVHDLNLEVTKGSEKWLPWVLDPSKPYDAPTRGIDVLNNTEQVTIDNPEAGSYTLMISGDNITKNQRYAIAYEFEQDVIIPIFPHGGDQLVTGENYIFNWDAEGNLEKYEVEISYDNGKSWKALGQNLDSKHKYIHYTCPDVLTSKAKLRITSGNLVTESTCFSISPEIVFTSIERGYQSAKLKWQPILGVVKYAVYKIVDGELSKIAEVNTSAYDITGLKLGKKDWFSVAPVFADGSEGMRNEAVPVSSIDAYDVALEEIVNPWSGSHLTSQEEFVVRVKNTGANEIPAGEVFNIGYEMNNGNSKTNAIVLERSLLPGSSVDLKCKDKLFMEVPRSYELKVWVKTELDKNQGTNDTLFRYVQKTEVISKFPYTYSFDGQLNLSQLIRTVYDPVFLSDGWLNDRVNDDFDWWPVGGRVYQEDNGPSGGYKGDGKYMYTETFFQNELPATANLLTPSFNLMSINKPMLQFYYHMYSEKNDMGTLHVDIYREEANTWETDIIEPLVETEDNKWNICHIDLADYKHDGPVRFRFRMESSKSVRNSIAIDEFQISEKRKFDWELLELLPSQTGDRLTNSEKVTVSLLNKGAQTYPQGIELPVTFTCEGTITDENIVLSREVKPLDTLTYTFKRTIDLSDLTKRYLLTSWSSFESDEYRKNDSIMEQYVQSYVETEANCLANYNFVGIGFFKLNGVVPNYSLESLSACENTLTSGYSFFPERMARLYKGENYEFALGCITPPPEFQIQPTGVFFKIWIDLNGNGKFEANEKVYENDWLDYIKLTDKIEIPTDREFTGKTRLRIQASYYREDLLENGDAKEIRLGETEDYIVDIRDYPKFDIGITHFDEMPESGMNLSSEQIVSFTIKNDGRNSIDRGTVLKFGMNINGQKEIVEDFVLENSFQTGTVRKVDLKQTVDLSHEGSYSVKVWVDGGDDNELNDTLVYRVQCLGMFDAENYNEDFENGGGGWFDASDMDKAYWVHGTPAKEKLTNAAGGANCWATTLTEAYPDNGRLVLQSPVFSFKKVDEPLLSFDLFYDSEEDWDGMIMEYRVKDQDWVKIGTQKDGFYNNNNETENADWKLGLPWWSGSSSDWERKNIKVKELAGKEGVSFRFRFYSDQYEHFEGAAIDNFSISNNGETAIEEPMSCEFTVSPNPTNGPLTITFGKPLADGGFLTIHTLDGQLIHMAEVSAKSISYKLDMSACANGMYLVKIRTKNEVLQTKVLLNN